MFTFLLVMQMFRLLKPLKKSKHPNHVVLTLPILSYRKSMP